MDDGMGHFAFEPIPRDPADVNQKQSMRFHWLAVAAIYYKLELNTLIQLRQDNTPSTK
jgi:hypothetical protein